MQYLSKPLTGIDGLLDVDQMIDISTKADPEDFNLICPDLGCNTTTGCNCQPQ